ncbi:FMN-binding glutamate synthase family protein [Arcobacter venerupis]|uniref:FMN-binding glutamate synthase family protein n=1 Tax=Arcobacter venerupis TaxID=1054033 RepID=A0AAE7BDA0_9BACT|nr:FMN-binding glutamate synthase family protein [Arcobacter venerupis]QKF68187.1 FMN-binding glutamate synthase family protein [Arcobacter venerupis]RWS48571.1 FMN-binding glutamate synthase family protein [Arcobacter venerupis]
MTVGILVFLIFIIVILAWYIHDKYVQRKHQILVNYPIIGRLRFVFQEFREPFRQYFGDEKFYESMDKLEWVYSAARDKINYSSFSPSQPLPKPKFMLRHTTIVLNDDEVDNDFSVVFGEKRGKPFKTSSIIARAPMSDGSISPEGTRAFVQGSQMGKFPINSGEGGLTSNFFVTHNNYNEKYMTEVIGNDLQQKIFKLSKFLFNVPVAIDIYRKLVFKKNPLKDTYVFNKQNESFYRPNWDAPLENFPEEVPSDMPEIILQISSGLYGVRTKDGKLDIERYKKQMSFCKMTEIKLAQGAKQTGGKLIAQKVTPSIGYYRNIEPYKDAFSPNRFPYANSIEELFDFIGTLQEASQKPVGIKIVISDYDNIVPIAKEIKRRVELNLPYPDYISIDGGSGGSATAPLDMMERIGMDIRDALYLVDKVLKDYGVREHVKISASGKILTPDDVIIILCLGADFVQIARGFMMSAGCIRARYCSGATKHQCPVGLATQDIKKRKNYFVAKHSEYIKNYHNNVLKSMKSLLAVMGLKNVKGLTKEKLIFLDIDSKIHDDMDSLFERRIFEKQK